MSKKSFTSGLDSLLGEQGDKPKRGRPVTQTKEVSKTSQEGTKENETRATFIVNEDLLQKCKAIAYWDRVLIKDVVNVSLEETVKNYIKKNGEIRDIP